MKPCCKKAKDELANEQRLSKLNNDTARKYIAQLEEVGRQNRLAVQVKNDRIANLERQLSKWASAAKGGSA